jgi:hypothetical protein
MARFARHSLRVSSVTPGSHWIGSDTETDDDVVHCGRVPAERTAVCGVSASRELALAIGLRQPDIYGAILCASPGAGFRPPDMMPRPIPRTYLVAGTEEPFFHENAARWAQALRE